MIKRKPYNCASKQTFIQVLLYDIYMIILFSFEFQSDSKGMFAKVISRMIGKSYVVITHYKKVRTMPKIIAHLFKIHSMLYIRHNICKHLI